MITEEEAKTKWCPFARDSLLEECRDGVTSYSFNRAVGCGAGELPENCLCIASDCMAWRATKDEIKDNPEGPVERGMAMYPSDYTSAGYCGLAGS